VTGHFLSYTFIVPVIRDVVGVRGPQAAWLLAAFGVAGLAAMAAFAGAGDRRPRATVLTELAVLVVVFGVLAALVGDRAGVPVTVSGVLAIIGWGAASTALPPVLQAAVMRAAPDDPDGASGLYVTAFQVGIMAGASGGGLLYELGGLTAMTAGSAVLCAVALIGVAAVRGLFTVPPVAARK
jgi:predicted MFS family arabinose efflux permease